MMEKYEEWLDSQDYDKNNFMFFYKETCITDDWKEVMANLAYEIFQLQICVDGLIEDMEEEFPE